VLVAAHLHVQSSLFSMLTVVVLVARLAQTAAHIASGNDRAVLLRGAFFTVQTVTQAAMLLVLLATIFGAAAPTTAPTP
jgi:hypothetical protein